MLRPRRRPRYGTQLCAVISALLLLLSLSILHNKLSSSSSSPQSRHFQTTDPNSLDTDLDALVANPLLEDVITTTAESLTNDDLIDELDVIDGVSDKQDSEDDDDHPGLGFKRVTGFYWDHVVGSQRRAFDRQLIDPWENKNENENEEEEEGDRVAFASDDQPVNEEIRVKFDGVRGIEDALLVKLPGRAGESRLREGWASWFEKKGDFLRRDKMFKSNFEGLNPRNNPLLQDPDGVGVTVLTRGDKIMQKSLLKEFQKSVGGKDSREMEVGIGRRNAVKRVERRTLDDNAGGKNVVVSTKPLNLSKKVDVDSGSGSGSSLDNVLIEQNVLRDRSNNSELDGKGQSDTELLDYKYADGRRWGYFPGLRSDLSFSEFVEEFFKQGKCSMRVFMVWNSSPWMYTVRHQRGLESLLYHHPDACVVVFSETIDLDFFKDFVKDGFKVAVAMPNLDELLKDTPVHIFASVWFEWRKTMFYSIHYSELVRLASLYKYGGLYLDSDIIVLKPLFSLNNSIAAEDEPAKGSLNGAVMAFGKNSSFIMECLREFYSTYNDTLLRWNGADLLTRTVKRFLTEKNVYIKQQELEIQPASMFFPVSSQEITRYFRAPADEAERTQQYILLQKVLDGSYTFHFWNGLTSPLVPEPDSLVAKLLNHHCIHCTDVL